MERGVVSLIPAFELALWNAWIFILPIIIISFFGSKILRKRTPEEDARTNKKAKTVSILYFALVLLLYAYSAFLPLKLNTIWFVVGLLIYLPVLLFLIIGLLNFATTPEEKLVTKGVYSISRNPSYVSDVLLMTSIGIACLSWVFLLVAAVHFFLLRYYVVAAEEPFLIEKYGETYVEYMNRTPRWIGIPKSEKRD